VAFSLSIKKKRCDRQKWGIFPKFSGVKITTYNKRLLRESVKAKKNTKAIIAAKKTGWPEMTILRASLEVQGDRLKK